MESLLPILIADLLLISLSVFTARKRLSFAHPLTHYLFFHVYCFTWRGWALFNGATPMFEFPPRFEEIRPSECFRGLAWADISLICFSLGSFFCKLRPSQDRQQRRKSLLTDPINPDNVKLIFVFAVPIGVFAFARAKLGVVDQQLSQINAFFAFWPSCCILMSIFTFGYRLHFVFLLALYLVAVAFQGYHRYMVALPVLFLCGLALVKLNRKWPPKKWAVVLLLLFLIFPQLKYIGRAVQNGDLQGVYDRVAQSFEFDLTNRSEDFLDQLSGAITLVDESKKIYWGETYLYPAYLVIPRFYWPDKPGIAHHLKEVSTPDRPYAQDGRIITLIGESYFNFRAPGIVLISFILGFMLTQWYVLIASLPSNSFSVYLYLVFMTTFIQVFRDGLVSFFMFGILQNAPMLSLVVLQSLNPIPTGRKRLHSTGAGPSFSAADFIGRTD